MVQKNSKRVATMADVARLAGVSRPTVSFVLNNTGISASIPAETKERIMEAAKKLSYRPNLAAKSLKTNQTHTIGFVTDEIATTPHAVNIIKGAQDKAMENGKLLLIINTGLSATVKETAIEMMLERQVEGMVFASMFHHEVELPSNIYELPTVLIDCFDAKRTLPSVVPDEVQGGRTATEVLLEKGHRRIGFINNIDPFPAAFGRLKGYKEALENYGIPFDETLVVTHGSSSKGGYDGARELMALKNPPTAIFCFSDFMAMGAYDAFRKLGLSIPGDVAVIGFDNHELIASHLYPQLSSMELPHYKMGEWAIEFLLNNEDGTLPLLQQTLPCPYIERDSV